MPAWQSSGLKITEIRCVRKMEEYLDMGGLDSIDMGSLGKKAGSVKERGDGVQSNVGSVSVELVGREKGMLGRGFPREVEGGGGGGGDYLGQFGAGSGWLVGRGGNMVEGAGWLGYWREIGLDRAGLLVYDRGFIGCGGMLVGCRGVVDRNGEGREVRRGKGGYSAPLEKQFREAYRIYAHHRSQLETRQQQTLPDVEMLSRRSYVERIDIPMS
ncbi:hypothetical protein Tco_1174624 [Tanacetum coccineum]